MPGIIKGQALTNVPLDEPPLSAYTMPSYTLVILNMLLKDLSNL